MDPSADGWMKQTFSIWLPQRLPLALVGWWAYCTHHLALQWEVTSQEDYVITANDTHYHSHVTSL